MTNVLAIDLGTATGWARLRDGEIAYGTYKLPNNTGVDVGRYLSVYDEWLTMFADGYDRVVFEAPFAGKGQAAAVKLLNLAGHTEFVCHRKGIRCSQTHISKVSKHFLGKCPPRRDEKKAATMKMCRVLGWEPQTEHEADALAVLHYAIHCMRLPVDLPTGPLFAKGKVA